MKENIEDVINNIHQEAVKLTHTENDIIKNLYKCFSSDEISGKVNSIEASFHKSFGNLMDSVDLLNLHLSRLNNLERKK